MTARKAFLLALLLLAPLALPATPAADFDYGSSVVSVEVTYQTWDEDRPWMKSEPRSRTASAVPLDDHRLLTTAQIVADSTLIQVAKHGSSSKTPARVLHIDLDANLALLTVDARGFFDDLVPVELAATIPTEGNLASVRWRRRQLEVSSSRVSRLQVQEVYYGNLAHVFLFLRTDLSGGGWAEPVFDGDELVGLSISQNDQVMRAIPATVIRQYLDAVEAPGPYAGLPTLWLVWQTNRDPALASFLGLEGPPRGVVVRAVPWGSCAFGVLRERDILLEVDGHPIDPDGYYQHLAYGRLSFTDIAIDGHRTGDRIPLKVLREGREVEVELTLHPYPVRMQLVPWQRKNQAPPFLIAGGLLFRELDGPYLRSWGKNWERKAPTNLVARWKRDRHGQSPERRRVVLLTAVIPDAINVGYHDLRDLEVARVNGRPVDSIDALAEALAHPEGGFQVIEFEPNMTRAEIVLDAAGFEAATARILQAFNIPLGGRQDPPFDLPYGAAQP
ncbi:MAG: hypothetical protein Q9Q13_00160 [Acidobacteriota bacterium]|nr:hypothetical protein [Acidobacteriota bacterium]